MTERINTLQSVIDYLIDNGVSEWDVNLLIHVNYVALGDENSNIKRLAQEGEWEKIWGFVELYVAGDLW